MKNDFLLQFFGLIRSEVSSLVQLLVSFLLKLKKGKEKRKKK